MPFSMYSASVPVFQHMLRNLIHVLDKGVANAEARKFDPAVLTGSRLAPDMLPFTRQIQIASDAAKGCVARLAGEAVPSWEDKEATLDELVERLERTRDYVLSLPAAAFEGSETRAIEIPRRIVAEKTQRGRDRRRGVALPNFYFHATTAYDILRHQGVAVGKMDYLGTLPMEEAG